jgi:hypothetical protein
MAEQLKLIALDADDLAVISAHLQDAVIKVGDVAFLPRQKRFAAVGNRFDWAAAMRDEEVRNGGFARHRSALRFERVLGAKLLGIDLDNKATVLSLLAISFEPENPPQGKVTLQFAEGAAIQLDVECIEAELQDLGPVWRAQSKPRHPDDDAAPRDKS